MMNNLYDEDYREMLKYFRSSDLRALLEAFGENNLGHRTELRERALELLNSRPNDLNYVAYLSKIYDIYHLLPCHRSVFPNDNTMLSSMQTQQRQIMSISQIPQQRMYRPPQYQQSMYTPQYQQSMYTPQYQQSMYTPQYQQSMYTPQYQQSMYTPQARLPHLMTKMEGGIYGNATGANTIPENTMANNQIEYVSGSYQPVRSRIIVPSPLPSQMPSNQQNMYTMIQNTLRFVLNASTGRNNNALIPSPQIVANCKFKNLPFYDVIDDIIKPTLLDGSEICTLSNFVKGMRECTFEHTLSVEHASLISMNRDISPGKPEYYGIQCQIRICQLENDVYDEVPDCLPIGLHIRVCNHYCTFPPIVTRDRERSGMKSRRASRPINIAQFIKLSPFTKNVITVNWIPDGKNYALSMFIVKQLCADTLMKKLHDKTPRSSEETKNYIIKKLTNVDPELTTTSSYNFSLVCPLSKVRMKIPAKSIHCDHIQCFDAGTFILMNEKKPQWKCPTCNKSCLYDDIQIENYFLEIITSPTLSDDINVIEVLADGSWIIPEENKDTKNMNSTIDNKVKPIDFIDLDDIGDEKFIESEEEPMPGGSECQKSKNLKPHLVDMTTDEDEEPSKQKDKL